MLRQATVVTQRAVIASLEAAKLIADNRQPQANAALPAVAEPVIVAPPAPNQTTACASCAPTQAQMADMF